MMKKWIRGVSVDILIPFATEIHRKRCEFKLTTAAVLHEAQKCSIFWDILVENQITKNQYHTHVCTLNMKLQPGDGQFSLAEYKDWKQGGTAWLCTKVTKCTYQHL